MSLGELSFLVLALVSKSFIDRFLGDKDKVLTVFLVIMKMKCAQSLSERTQ